MSPLQQTQENKTGEVSLGFRNRRQHIVLFPDHIFHSRSQEVCLTCVHWKGILFSQLQSGQAVGLYCVTERLALKTHGKSVSIGSHSDFSIYILQNSEAPSAVYVLLLWQ